MENTDWKNLPFGFHNTAYNIRCYFRNGEWGELEISSSNTINIHMAATCLHYGQEVFEGMKAYQRKDGRIQIFRWQENAKRMARSSSGIIMEPIPEEKFKEAVFEVVRLNKKFVPPHGSGATLYIRPLLIGTGAEVGVKPANEYLFMVFTTPVGPYFKEGFKPVEVMVCRHFDRTAPLGTGNLKVGGNYAASLASLKEAHEKGYATAMYLDAKEKKYIDECGPANFFGIKNNTYVTPDSRSILPSITNMSLMDLARDMGMKVEKRPVPIEELGSFEEAGQCGTAAVISPISKIVDPDLKHEYVYSKDGKPGPFCVKFYEKLSGIQFGDVEDKFGWTEVVC